MSTSLRQAQSGNARSFASEAPQETTGSTPPARRRGRPPLASRDDVLAQIRAACSSGELFRVHILQPALYARARRMFGTWSAALDAAGVDHSAVILEARRRAVESRRVRRGER